MSGVLTLYCNASRFLELLKGIRYDPTEFVVTSLRSLDPFELIICIMLSQNTSDRNAIRAFHELKKRVGVKPEDIVKASVDEIAEAIRVAGLHRQRAQRMKSLAKIVLEEFKGDLTSICRFSGEEARRILLSLPGVGYKTADIFLDVVCGFNFFPIDTHVKRVLGRLGFEGKTYNELALKFTSFFRNIPVDFFQIHLKLITIGRRYCKPRRPLCDECVLRECCRYAHEKTSSPHRK